MDRTLVHAGKFTETTRLDHFIKKATQWVAFFEGAMKRKRRIRTVAICVFRHRDRILVNQGYDPVKDEYFYRPLGGAIEFGEPSAETVCRELKEELNVAVDKESLRYLGAVENIFIFNGNPGHEIVLIYDGLLKDSKLYEQAVIVGKETGGEDMRAVWKALGEFREGKSILYPTGLLEMLTA
jgi:8-oxo-dGTP pyrophosphatase MutT (NUDIX family)